MNKCPICLRELDQNPEEHHLIPKTFKGKETISVHPICHRTIHATFSERELLNYYNSVEHILEHPSIQKFVNWIKNKPIDFFVSTRDSTDRKRKRI